MMAAYLAVESWKRNLDCVAIDRDELTQFWGLKRRVEDQRVDWLADDSKAFFKHVKLLRYRGGKFGGVWMSRRDFPFGAFAGTMSDEVRAKELTELGLSSGVVTLPTEAEVLAQLSAMVHGIGD